MAKSIDELKFEVFKEAIGIDNIDEEAMEQIIDAVSPVVECIKPIIEELVNAIISYMHSDEFIYQFIAELKKQGKIQQAIEQYGKINNTDRP